MILGLRGRHTTILWCRDRQNTWQTELAEGKPPETAPAGSRRSPCGWHWRVASVGCHAHACRGHVRKQAPHDQDLRPLGRRLDDARRAGPAGAARFQAVRGGPDRVLKSAPGGILAWVMPLAGRRSGGWRGALRSGASERGKGMQDWGASIASLPARGQPGKSASCRAKSESRRCVATGASIRTTAEMNCPLVEGTACRRECRICAPFSRVLGTLFNCTVLLVLIESKYLCRRELLRGNPG